MRTVLISLTVAASIDRIVLLVALMRLTQAICLLMDPTIKVTGTFILVENFPPYVPGVFIGVASLMALLSPWVRSARVALFLTIWQQFLLLLPIGTVIKAITESAYADGTHVPRLHLAADQCIFIFLGIFHAIAITKK